MTDPSGSSPGSGVRYDALISIMHGALLHGAEHGRVLEELTAAVATAAGVERVSIWRLNAQEDAIEAAMLFQASEARHSCGQVIHRTDAPSYFDAISGGEVVDAHDARSDPRTREFTEGYLTPLGITSMLDAPILVGGRMDGVVCLEHVGPPRSWSADERTFAVAVANVAALLLVERSRAEAEEQLRASEERMRAIIEAEPECVTLVSPEGLLLEMNPAGLRMVEATRPEAVLGKPIAGLIHEEDREAFLELHRRAESGEPGTLRFRIRGLKGAERWVESHATLLRTPGRGADGVLSVTRDITARVRAEAEARESRRRLETLMDHLPGMAYRGRTEPGWGMEVVSEGVHALTGYEPAEFLAEGGVRFGDLIHPEDRRRVWDEVQRAVRDAAPFELTYRIRTAQGEERWVWEQGRSVGIGEDGSPVIEGFVSDITKQKGLEYELAESRRMESIGRLAGGIAHDFNNLLSVILGTVELMVGELSEVHPLRSDLEDIRKAGERASSLTRQLLAFSRRQVMQPRPVDLNELVRDMLRFLRRLIGEDVKVVFQAGEDLHLVEVDPAQMEQVLTNLVVNARDAMPDGGTLVLETRNAPATGADPESEGERGAEGRGVMLTVQDTGGGMDPATRERIFEPFFTTKTPGEGSGLGLSTVYGIVQQSGGEIEAESRVGEGTIFRIRLPAVSWSAEEAASFEASGGVGPAASVNGEGQSILVVEDEEGLARVAQRLLQRAGFTVLRAQSGEEALSLLASHPARVDLLFTDVVMPGMSGPQVAQEVQARSPATRVLFTSGYTHDILERHGLRPEAIAFLPKPYTGDELIRRIREVLTPE